MDRSTTSFEILKNEDGEIVGFQISSAGSTEDEHFCEMLPKNLNEGKASITISDGEIHIKSIGIGGEEEWRFNLYEDEEPIFQKIISGLGKTYHPSCKTTGGFGVSFIAIFKEVVPLNKKELNKRARSIWRSLTPPKDLSRIEEWKRIFT